MVQRHMGRGRVKERMGQTCGEGRHPDERLQTLRGCLFHELQKPYLCVCALNRPTVNPRLTAGIQVRKGAMTQLSSE